MKKRLFTLTCFLLGLLSFTTQAQIISVTPGTDFNIVAATVIAADGMDITASADFTINGSSLIRTATAANAIPFINIARGYQFSSSTNPFSGTVGFNYADNELNSIAENTLSLAIQNGSIWNSYTASVRNGSSNYVQTTSLNNVPLNELTLADVTTWKGSGNGSWNNAANWTDGIPTSSINVLINTPAPLLDVDYSIAVSKSLTLGGTGALTINAANTFAVSGTANFGGKLVTVKSDITGTGSIGKITGTLTGATNVTVERYIGTAKRAWRLLTIPVTGQTIRAAWAGADANGAAPANEIGGSGTLITGHGYSVGATAVAAGYDWFTGLGSGTTSSIRFYDAGWASATHTPNVLSTPAKQGYMLFVRGDRTIIGTGSSTTTLKPKGELNIGTKTVSINAAYELVGNPYASAINIHEMYINTGNDAKINPNFWVWDVTLGTSGGFRSLSRNSGSSYILAGGSDAAEYLKIQSGQAFFVEKKDAGGTIAILEANKMASSSTPVIFRTTSIDGPVGLLNVNLYKAAQLVDGTTVRFNDGYDRAATEEYDVIKLNNFNENLSVVRDNRYLSIESFPYPTNTDTVFLSFWNLAANNYSFRLNTVDLGGKLTSAILIDRFTSQQTALDLTGANTDYAFSVTSDAGSSSLSRFIIVMKALVILPLNFTKVTATAKQTGIEVNWKTMSETGVRDFDVEKSADGLLFAKAFTTAASNNATGKNYGWLDVQPTEGWNYYRIRSNDLASQKQYSSIVKALWKNTGSITVYPNQTTDGKVTLNFKGLPAGDYGIVLTITNGEQVYKSNLSHTGGNNSYVFNLRGSGSLLAGGVYVLSITDTKGTKTNFSIVLAN